MGAGHHHGPSVDEAEQSPDFRKKLWIAFGLTAAIVLIQFGDDRHRQFGAADRSRSRTD